MGGAAVADPEVTTDMGVDELQKLFEMPSPTWKVLVWDDDVNTQEYVVAVFMKHFELEPEVAIEKMFEVHESGKSTLADGDRDAMLAHKEAMNAYGLQATVESD